MGQSKASHGDNNSVDRRVFLSLTGGMLAAGAGHFHAAEQNVSEASSEVSSTRIPSYPVELRREEGNNALYTGHLEDPWHEPSRREILDPNDTIKTSAFALQTKQQWINHLVTLRGDAPKPADFIRKHWQSHAEIDAWLDDFYELDRLTADELGRMGCYAIGLEIFSQLSKAEQKSTGIYESGFIDAYETWTPYACLDDDPTHLETLLRNKGWEITID